MIELYHVLKTSGMQMVGDAVRYKRNKHIDQMWKFLSEGRHVLTEIINIFTAYEIGVSYIILLIF